MLSRFCSILATDLEALVKDLKITKKQFDSLSLFGIKSFIDLLLTTPSQIIDLRQVNKISLLQDSDFCQVKGEIVYKNHIKSRKMLNIKIKDDSGVLNVWWFNVFYSQGQNFSIGKKIIANGVVKESNNGLLLSHPKYKLIDNSSSDDEFLKIDFIYPKIKGLRNSTVIKIISKGLLFLEETYGKENGTTTKEVVKLVLKDNDLSFLEALFLLHDDKNYTLSKYTQAKERLAVEELIANTITHWKQSRVVVKSEFVVGDVFSNLVNTFIEKLPFSLTNDQKMAVLDITKDMSKSRLMSRLVQGEVGCGKTVVCILSSYIALLHGWKVCILVPTSILASQHFISFSELLGKEFHIDILLGSSNKKHRENINKLIVSDKPCVIVGTHALIQEGIKFKNLALVVTDEQHRFGVKQRLALLKLSDKKPHQLFLTATPIPRTLLMSMYGDIEISFIRALPANRKDIHSSLLHEDKKNHLMDRIVSNCLESKNQAYWVCPLIEETENMNANNLLQVEKDFKQRYPNFPCAILHGKMKSNEKDEILNRFNKKEILLLIATTVIEVGVHVEDATIMVIENAERYGLAQLHQLRGRVGRGKNKSFCILLVKQDISQTSLERIKILAKTKDGFSIAEQDFKNRGGGSLFGENQSGRRMFKIADLYANSDILQSIQKHKKEIASSIDIASMSSVWIGENIDLANS